MHKMQVHLEGVSVVHPREIARMFTSIARRYDLANTLLSFGRDGYWRRVAVSSLRVKRGDVILDIATGTGKLAQEAIRAGALVVGIDISHEMLRIARKRLGIAFLRQDALKLGFKDESFDGVMVAFGIRNMASIERALREMIRVVKKGGRVVVLEFALPENPVIRRIYSLYFFHILPRLGGLIAGNRDAYEYLVKSVASFPKPGEVKKIMERLGLETELRFLTFGTVACYTGVKR